jgi:hypothetical protein
MRRLCAGWITALVALSAASCSKAPSRIAASGIDPSGAASRAIEAYDKNADGKLSKEELAACPALLSAIATYDTNNDQSIDESEIEARLQSWVDSGIGISNATFYLKLDGQPIPNAKVTLDPEPFLGDAVKPATGQSDQTGRVGPTLPPDQLPQGIRFGLLSGLYKVRVSHPAIASPAKYGEQTTLGIEVPPQFDVYNPPTLELTNK